MRTGVFNTSDFLEQFPELVAFSATVEFPYPFTVGDYKTWQRATSATSKGKKKKRRENDINKLVFWAEFRGAMAVCEVLPTPNADVSDGEIDDDEITAVSDDVSDDEFDIDLSSTSLAPSALDYALLFDEDTVPLSFASFLRIVADSYIGPQLVVETPQVTLQRRSNNSYQFPAFKTQYDLDLLPDMKEYKGFVVYNNPLTTEVYRKWARVVKRHVSSDSQDVDNSLLMRSLRGAASLVKEFKIQGLSWEALRANDFDTMPLIVASWLIETADVFLSRRMTLKK